MTSSIDNIYLFLSLIVASAYKLARTPTASISSALISLEMLGVAGGRQRSGIAGSRIDVLIRGILSSTSL